MLKKILFTLILTTAVWSSGAAGTESIDTLPATGTIDPEIIIPALDETAAEEVLPTFPDGQPPEGMEEKKGAVIKVTGSKVYVDIGAVDGVAENTVMHVFHMEPIRNLDGEVLDEEEVGVGKIRIIEVRPRISIGAILDKSDVPERGYFVRFWLPVEREKMTVSKGRCPPEMLFDGGGPFVFKPGSHFKNIPPSEKQTLETEPFCIDRDPTNEPVTWAEARSTCARQGKRLCNKAELQKVCAIWEKPVPCPAELEEKGQCPEPETVVDFRSALEWTTETIIKDNAPFQDAYSCACPASDPVCVHCFYEECRGATKRYRCCHNSYSSAKTSSKNK